MKSLEQLKTLKESEDKVEFKKGEGGNISYDGGYKTKPADRRRCILGYVSALCNEKGGYLVIGMHDTFPHKVIGTKQNEGLIGELESNIFRDLGIRTNIYELYEDQKRVLVIQVPPRPYGKVFKFEDVALMRVGEELRPMSDEVYLSIIQEQEPDFSQQICENITIENLDPNAIEILKIKYAKKQKNDTFRTLPNKQILSDLDLIKEDKVTNAALILLGKEEIIRMYLPQAAIMLEYRKNDAQIPFDNRHAYQSPIFLMIDKLWADIDFRNGSFPIKEGAYIFDIPYFNEEVIRESINNALAHRDYRRSGETVIKQYPLKLEIINPGGFPQGVTIDNLLTVPSTPRNRLLTDVLSKTGIVERSGQGIDKIFYYTLSEGKPEPDYSRSDFFHVVLSLSAVIEDKAFALFIESVQRSLLEDNKLSVLEIVTLEKIRKGINKNELDNDVVLKLKERKLIETRGKTNGIYYILCKDYYEFSENKAEYSQKTDWDITQGLGIISTFLTKYKTGKMGDFVKLFEGHITRNQVKFMVQKLVNEKILIPDGVKSGTSYSLTPNFKKQIETMGKALEIGFAELKNRGEL